jgi:minor extracellular serine protease Vpr
MLRFQFLFFVILSFTSFSQVSIPANTLSDCELITKEFKRSNGDFTSEFMERFALQRYGNEYFVSFVAKTNLNFSKSFFDDKGIISGEVFGDYVSLRVPVGLLNEIHLFQGLEVIQLAGKIKPCLDRAVADTRANNVHQGIDLPQGYTGKDVIIGITDWGFDYTSPMFYDTLLNQTRILAAWDQYKMSGPSPVNYSYGTEYSTSSDLILAGSDTANIYSYSTHGNHVAGIAGGSGAGLNYRGFAFESQFLFVTFLVDEAAVLDAWQWMYEKAQAEGKRLVINMSWGLYHLGTLDGNSILSQAIDAYSLNGVVFVNSGGNNGNVNFHIKRTFNNDSFSSKIDFFSYASNPNMWGQSIHMWGEQGQAFEAGLKVVNSSGTFTVETAYYATNEWTEYIDTFIVNGLDTVWYNISADDTHPLNSRPQMRLRVKNTNSSLRVLLKSKADGGTVHYWNVTELSTDVGNWGMPFSVYGSGTVAGDNQYGISEPSCTNSVISVAAYAPQYYPGGSNPVGGAIASFSSIGPRYDEVRKPDIAAPGVSIASSISSFTDGNYTSISTVDFEGRTYTFARLSGTSMASPAVAGICALILEANPYLSSVQVKDIIMLSARTDNFTGTIPSGGSNQWGYGKINAHEAVKLALQTIGVLELPLDSDLTIFPNPSSDIIHLNNLKFQPERVQLVSMTGQIKELECVANNVNVAGLLAGSYILRIEIDGKIKQTRFIKL